MKSYELLKYAGEEPPAEYTFQQWQVCCYQVPTVEIIAFLSDMHFLFAYRPSNMLLCADLLFWYHYSQLLKEILLKDQYIPALKYREVLQPKGKKKKQSETGLKTLDKPLLLTIESRNEKFDEGTKLILSRFMRLLQLVTHGNSGN